MRGIFAVTLGALSCTGGGGSGDIVIATVRIDPTDPTINIGETMVFVATPLDANGSVVIVNGEATWESLSPTVVTIDESGLATAVGVGTATIQAKLAGKTGQTQLTVQRLAVARVSVSPGTASLSRGQTTQFTAHVFAENDQELTDRVVTWTTLNGSVASVSGNGATVTVTGVAPGNATIRATSEGTAGDGFAVVNPDPVIALSSTTASFGGVRLGPDPAAQTINVSNAGGGSLTGLATAVQFQAGQPTGWLTAAVAPTTAPSTLTLTPTLGSLAAGTYNATVTVSSTAPAVASKTVAVTFTVAPGPTIALSTGTVSFAATQGGASPANQTVTVSNGGGGTLSGLSLGAPVFGPGASGWLTANLSGGTAPATITLAVTTGALATGSYSATIAVNSSLPGVASATLTVTLSVGSGAVIVLTPSSRSFSATAGGSNPASQTVSVTNGGPGTLSGLSLGTPTFSGGATGWLSASISSATAPATVTLNVTVGAIGTGTYTASLPVQSSAVGVATQTISVTFVVGTKPSLLPTPTSVTFNAPNGGGNPSQVSVFINTSGGASVSGVSVGTVTYGAGASGWLSTNLLNTSAPTNLLLNATVSGIPSGSYTATVPILSPNAGNSPVNITVTLVIPPPIIAVSTSAPSTFVRTQSAVTAGSVTINVTNGGGGQLTGLSVSSGASWLTASLNTNTTPAVLTLSLNTGAANLLPRGTFQTTVSVTSSVAANSPVTITATIQLRYTFAQHVLPVINGAVAGVPTCLGSSCHNSGANAPNLATSPYNTLLTGHKVTSPFTAYVVPGNPSASWVYQRVIGTSGAMPPSGTNSTTINRFFGWIADGALP